MLIRVLELALAVAALSTSRRLPEPLLDLLNDLVQERCSSPKARQTQVPRHEMLHLIHAIAGWPGDTSLGLQLNADKFAVIQAVAQAWRQLVELAN